MYDVYFNIRPYIKRTYNILAHTHTHTHTHIYRVSQSLPNQALL